MNTYTHRMLIAALFALPASLSFCSQQPTSATATATATQKIGVEKPAAQPVNATSSTDQKEAYSVYMARFDKMLLCIIDKQRSPEDDIFAHLPRINGWGRGANPS